MKGQLLSIYFMDLWVHSVLLYHLTKLWHSCCTLWVVNSVLSFFPSSLFVCLFVIFVQPSRWTCRKPWLKPLRPAPRSVWYWATLTAAGCPQPWPSSRVLVTTAPLLPLPPLASLVQCLPLASSRALHEELKPTWPAWGSWMVVTPWAGLYPKRMNWTKESIGRSSTTPWIDTAVVRRRTPSRSSHWRVSPPLSRPLEEAAAPSYTSTSCKRNRQICDVLARMRLCP